MKIMRLQPSSRARMAVVAAFVGHVRYGSVRHGGIGKKYQSSHKSRADRRAPASSFSLSFSSLRWDGYVLHRFRMTDQRRRDTGRVTLIGG